MSHDVSVLILDDEPIVGRRLGPALDKMGCKTETFENPEIALARIAEKEFDIVVTDIRMENLDGIEVLKRVIARSPRTKVIMITGYATMEIAREALAKGAFDFIAKPFKPNDLRLVVARAAKSLGLTLREGAEVASE